MYLIFSLVNNIIVFSPKKMVCHKLNTSNVWQSIDVKFQSSKQGQTMHVLYLNITVFKQTFTHMIVFFFFFNNLHDSIFYN